LNFTIPRFSSKSTRFGFCCAKADSSFVSATGSAVPVPTLLTASA
jgi:hypothetical protein